MDRPPCTCTEHKDGAPIEIDKHRFERVVGETWDDDLLLTRWRYVCSCGGRGQWTFQSGNVPYHGWLDHVRRARAAARRRRDLLQAEEMYT